MRKEEWKQRVGSWLNKLGKYRYTVLILLLGVGLMLIPFEKKSGSAPTAASSAVEEEPLEARLERLLSQVDGAGAVSVLLTLEKGPGKPIRRIRRPKATQTEPRARTRPFWCPQEEKKRPCRFRQLTPSTKARWWSVKGQTGPP